MPVAIRQIIALLLFGLCLWFNQSYVSLLEYNRQPIFDGEIWRLWTAHFVHSNHQHFVLNAAATFLIYFTFHVKIKTTELLIYSFIFPVLISLTLLFFYPTLAWYNGLSGVLHAVLAYCFVLRINNGHKIFWTGLGLIWLKVLVELIRTQLGHSGFIAEMHVISDAHLVGAFYGTLIPFVSHRFRVWQQ